MLLLIPLTLYATEPEMNVKNIKFPTVGFEKDGVTTGDYNIFDPYQKSFGMSRYGDGMSRIRVGDGFGMFLTSRTGTYLIPPSTSPLVVGIEPIAGILNIDSSDKYDSFYELTPAVSSGLAYKVTNDYTFAILGKYGFSVGNMQRSNLYPKMGSAWGYSFILNKEENGIFYNYYKTKGEDCHSFGIYLERMGVSGHKVGDRFEYYQVFIRLFNM